VNPDGFDTGAGDAVPGEPETNTSETNAPEAGDPDIFDGLVLDEAFVLAALIHEPSADERLKALRTGARRRGRAVSGGTHRDEAGRSAGIVVRRGRYQALPGRWQRVVARVMLVVIGMLAVLVAAAAVYRGSDAAGQPVPASSSGTGSGSAGSSALSVPR
jgi:hypothetical protein